MFEKLNIHIQNNNILQIENVIIYLNKHLNRYNKNSIIKIYTLINLILLFIKDRAQIFKQYNFKFNFFFLFIYYIHNIKFIYILYDQ